jgi:hypothetical protein
MRWWLLIFLSLLLRKSNAKFLLASLKTLTNLKVPPVTLFKELVAAFTNPPMTVKLALDPHPFGNLEPHPHQGYKPGPDPHQIKIRIRIRLNRFVLRN